MEAVIQISGKQYKVNNNSVIYTEKINKPVGDKIIFSDILMVNGIFDKTQLKKYVVEGVIEKQSKAKKLIVFTYKPKKNTKRKLGHRQPFTQIKITKIAKK